VDPVSCLQGDIYCRECALSNILAQKKEIKRLEKTLQQEEREQSEAKARHEAEAQERAIREFELTQAGLDVKASRDSARSRSREEHTPKLEANGDGKRGEKRKFSLDADEVERIAEEERAKARRAIEDEKVCWSCAVEWSHNSKLTVTAVSQTNAPFLLDTVSHTVIKQEQCLARHKEEDQDTTRMPCIIGRQAAPLLATYLGNGELHRGERRHN
jgi:hypothetical protein